MWTTGPWMRLSVDTTGSPPRIAQDLDDSQRGQLASTLLQFVAYCCTSRDEKVIYITISIFTGDSRLLLHIFISLCSESAGRLPVIWTGREGHSKVVKYTRHALI